MEIILIGCLTIGPTEHRAQLSITLFQNRATNLFYVYNTEYYGTGGYVDWVLPRSLEIMGRILLFLGYYSLLLSLFPD
jgi:hypothetical protein